ncbi:MAG: hypothetical protein JW913_17135, partial [Chitinispirillaceae bacterium]|nr:hypothetical protein [Chitinispirillaceae bacterium]
GSAKRYIEKRSQKCDYRGAAERSKLFARLTKLFARLAKFFARLAKLFGCRIDALPSLLPGEKKWGDPPNQLRYKFIASFPTAIERLPTGIETVNL